MPELSWIFHMWTSLTCRMRCSMPSWCLPFAYWLPETWVMFFNADLLQHARRSSRNKNRSFQWIWVRIVKPPQRMTDGCFIFYVLQYKLCGCVFFMFQHIYDVRKHQRLVGFCDPEWLHPNGFGCASWRSASKRLFSACSAETWQLWGTVSIPSIGAQMIFGMAVMMRIEEFYSKATFCRNMQKMTTSKDRNGSCTWAVWEALSACPQVARQSKAGSWDSANSPMVGKDWRQGLVTWRMWNVWIRVIPRAAPLPCLLHSIWCSESSPCNHLCVTSDIFRFLEGVTFTL